MENRISVKILVIINVKKEVKEVFVVAIFIIEEIDNIEIVTDSKNLNLNYIVAEDKNTERVVDV